MPLTSLFLAASLSLGGAPPTTEPSLEAYLLAFDYAARRDMKIESKELIRLLREGKVQLLDIRFKEEAAAWSVRGALNIPLNELPRRLAEVDRSKIVVTACPHKDRSAIAMAYLRSKGIPAKYLTDGLLGMVDQLRGEAARDFVESQHPHPAPGTATHRPSAGGAIPDGPTGE